MSLCAHVDGRPKCTIMSVFNAVLCGSRTQHNPLSGPLRSTLNGGPLRLGLAYLFTIARKAGMSGPLDTRLGLAPHGAITGAHGELYNMHTYVFKLSCPIYSHNEPIPLYGAHRNSIK